MLSAKVIGQRLRKLRGDRKASEVAEAIGISQSALSMYENGERVARDEVKVRIAAFYETTIEAIFYAS